jgi:hypothetical protein
MTPTRALETSRIVTVLPSGSYVSSNDEQQIVQLRYVHRYYIRPTRKLDVRAVHRCTASQRDWLLVFIVLARLVLSCVFAVETETPALTFATFGL